MYDSHTASLSVAQAQLPFLGWQAGREMESMKLQTGAQKYPSSWKLGKHESQWRGASVRR